MRTSERVCMQLYSKLCSIVNCAELTVNPRRHRWSVALAGCGPSFIRSWAGPTWCPRAIVANRPGCSRSPLRTYAQFKQVDVDGPLKRPVGSTALPAPQGGFLHEHAAAGPQYSRKSHTLPVPSGSHPSGWHVCKTVVLIPAPCYELHSVLA